MDLLPATLVFLLTRPLEEVDKHGLALVSAQTGFM